jgi:tetratricopeptide (TPR) repeat protein
MASPPEEERSDALADQVDKALEALWEGDSTVFDDLLGAEGATGVGVIEILKPAADTVIGPATEPAGLPEIEGYTITREIGRGGMGVVYEAKQAGTKRVVALKVMLGWPFASETGRKRFRREVQLAARLHHENIVRILESGELAGGEPYYAMEYIDAVTLDRYLAATRRSAPAVLGLFVAICEAVEHAHRQGVIHRDLKPGNVLIDEDGQPHILDFGLAKSTVPSETDASLLDVTSPGQLVGTFRYLSPEQAIGEPGAVDGRTDVFAIGVMLYEALTGSLPFGAMADPSAIVREIVDAAPAAPSTLSPAVDRDLETIILKALAKERALRYPSALDLGTDIRRYLNGEPVLARRPSSLYVARKTLVRHRRSVIVSTAFLLMIAVSSIIGVLWARRESAEALDLARLTQERVLTENLAGALQLTLNRIAQEGPQNGLYENAIRILFKLRDHEKALTLANEYADFNQGAIFAHRARGTAHLCLKHYKAAISAYTEAIRRAPVGTWDRYHRATPLWIVGRYTDAEVHYRNHIAYMGEITYADPRLYLVLHDAARNAAAQGLDEEATRFRDRAERALADAQNRAGADPDSWLATIVDCLAGDMEPEELMQIASDDGNRQLVCEACYYAAEKCLLDGQGFEARRYFEACVGTGLAVDPDTDPVVPMNEFHLARWRLDTLSCGEDPGAQSARRLPN